MLQSIEQELIYELDADINFLNRIRSKLDAIENELRNHKFSDSLEDEVGEIVDSLDDLDCKVGDAIEAAEDLQKETPYNYEKRRAFWSSRIWYPLMLKYKE